MAEEEFLTEDVGDALLHAEGASDRALQTDSPDASPVKPIKAGEGKGQGKGKGKGKAGGIWRKCRGCSQWFDEALVPNSAFCLIDKRALDTIARRADREGEEAKRFYKEVREDDSRVKELLDVYFRAIGGRPTADAERFKRKGGTFSVLRFKESFEARTSVTTKQRCTLMSKDVYIQWAQTIKGGRLTPEEAQRKWDGFMADPNVRKEEEVPGKKSCYVPTAKLLDFDNSLSRSKGFELVGQDIKGKNITSATIATQQKRLPARCC